MSIANGSPASWADIQTELGTLRTGLATVAPADLADGTTIDRNALLRPVMSGFPNTGVDGEHDLILIRKYGLNNPDAVKLAEWGRRRERIIIQPTTMGPSEVWRTPLGATFDLWREAEVDLSMSIEYQIRCLEAPAPAGGPQYPTAALGSNAGYFTLLLWNRESLQETNIVASRLHVYPMDYAASGGNVVLNDGGSLYWSGTLDAGGYDVQLAWVKDTAPTALAQIDVSRVVGKVKAHL